MHREQIIQETENWILSQGYRIANKDIQRPWGAYWHIHPEDTMSFVKEFFPKRILHSKNPISPKVLLVLPQQRLSLQVHRLRSESWAVIQGPVDIVLGAKQKTYESFDQIEVPLNTRHRLIGLDKSAIIAEIWIHEDQQHPSTESDIERLEDDYQRK